MKGSPINHCDYAKYSLVLSLGVYILSDYAKYSLVLSLGVCILSDYTKYSLALVARAYAHARGRVVHTHGRVMHTHEGGAA